ncbi:tRNA(Ile)-lysidine synthase [Mycoplasmopsis caviae]|nr:tRNA(Ile)-lysidine synthase [Mycoplasmopsis caviae]
MYILGISGGPDSMLLLDEYAHKSEPIFVICINYNQRADSYKDVEIVRSYCTKNNINFEIYNFDKNDYKTGNFEEWAREKRMDIFINKYHELKASKILLAHHKDDFIETVFMQKEAKRTPSFWGIKEFNIYKGCIIERPFVNKYFKDEILIKCKERNIDYALDYTNSLPIYTRNKFRIQLSKLSNEQKQKILDEIYEQNKKLALQEIKHSSVYKQWEENKFRVSFFCTLNYEYQKQLIRKFVFANCNEKINLSSGKIDNLVNFVKANNTKKPQFLLNNKYYLQKENGILMFKTKLNI